MINITRICNSKIDQEEFYDFVHRCLYFNNNDLRYFVKIDIKVKCGKCFYKNSCDALQEYYEMNLYLINNYYGKEKLEFKKDYLIKIKNRFYYDTRY
jgi:hypothetical protein